MIADAVTARAPASDGSDDTTFLALEIALAASSLAAAVAAIGLGRRNRKR